VELIFLILELLFLHKISYTQL